MKLTATCLVAALLTAVTADSETRVSAVLPPSGKVVDQSTAGSVSTPLGLLSAAGSLGLLGPTNPLLSTILLSALLGAAPTPYHHQHGGLLPVLLAQQYGRYLPYGLGAYGLYGYSASNAVHNSKPFGAYKYEDRL